MWAKLRKRDGGRCFVRACARKEEGAEGVGDRKRKKGDGGGAEDGTREDGTRGELEVEALASEVVLTCTEMPSPCHVAGREEPRQPSQEDQRPRKQ